VLDAQPPTAIDNEGHGAVANPELSRQFLDGISVGVSSAYVADDLSGQLCLSVPLSARAATLRHHVLGVLFSRPKEQVTWVDAKPNVALVENAYPLWDFPHMNQVRESVGAQLAFLEPGTLAVSMTSLGGSPNPAPIGVGGLLDLRVEAFDDSMGCVQGASPFQTLAGAATGTLVTSPVFIVPKLC
jgi:hypothetical protein